MLNDSRGYSLCFFNTRCSLRHDQVTYPPNTYPSTAPYAQLTNYFRELVRDGTLSRFIVKALLYPEFLREFDISDIKMRRKHKSKKKLKRRNRNESWFVTESSSDEGEEDEDPEGSRIFRSTSRSSTGSEVCDECEEVSEKDCSGSCEDSTYGLIEYYTGKKSPKSCELTDYESFIDHGAQTEDVADEFFISAPFCDTPPGNDQVLSDTEVSSDRSDERNSLRFGSNTTQLTEATPRTSQSPVHTSTARMNLAAIKQQESQMSSFEHQLGGHMACEDLVNVDEEMLIKNCLKPKPIIETRHSMPMYFVGNRFNTTSKTEIYIPTWKDKQESRERSKDTSKKDSIRSSEKKHSREKDIAELEAERESAFTPPEMFRNESVQTPVLSLSREATPFRKHSINSDKRMSGHSLHEKRGSAMSVQLEPHQEEICGTSLNFTPRSSDSGMAGSCTISSPLYDLLPSPPLTEVTIHPEPFFNAILKDLNNNNDSRQFERTSFVKNETEQHSNKSKSNETLIDANIDALIHSLPPVISAENQKSNNNLHENTHQRHTTSELVINVQSPVDKTVLNNNNVIIIKNEPEMSSSEETTGPTIYRTGLYAHWWKKEKLPNQMIDGIVSDIHKNNNNNDLASATEITRSTTRTTTPSPPPPKTLIITKPNYRDIKQTTTHFGYEQEKCKNNDNKDHKNHSRKPMKITVVRKKGSGKQKVLVISYFCVK